MFYCATVCVAVCCFVTKSNGHQEETSVYCSVCCNVCCSVLRSVLSRDSEQWPSARDQYAL